MRTVDGDPLLVVMFSCQQIKCTRDKFGNVLEGSPSDIQKARERLTDRRPPPAAAAPAPASGGLALRGCQRALGGAAWAAATRRSWGGVSGTRPGVERPTSAPPLPTRTPPRLGAGLLLLGAVAGALGVGHPGGCLPAPPLGHQGHDVAVDADAGLSARARAGGRAGGCGRVPLPAHAAPSSRAGPRARAARAAASGRSERASGGRAAAASAHRWRTGGAPRPLRAPSSGARAT